MTISAKIIKDSISLDGVRLTTMEMQYPRFVHSEFLTHRMLSKNSASSRAIPVEKLNAMIDESPAMPVHWGKNQPGMQANTELEGITKQGAIETWIAASKSALTYAKVLQSIGLHKQITNRLCEPWQTMKTVVSGTEWANLLWLRNHDAAQPEFHELAKQIQEAFDNSVPTKLEGGQWHLPYIEENSTLTLADQIRVSASCCAQVSYRKLDDSVEKALDIYEKLVSMSRKHSSPFEHQATPIPNIPPFTAWPEGVSHRDRQGQYWSGNFKGWIQLRKTMDGENHSE